MAFFHSIKGFSTHWVSLAPILVENIDFARSASVSAKKWLL